MTQGGPFLFLLCGMMGQGRGWLWKPMWLSQWPPHNLVSLGASSRSHWGEDEAGKGPTLVVLRQEALRADWASHLGWDPGGISGTGGFWNVHAHRQPVHGGQLGAAAQPVPLPGKACSVPSSPWVHKGLFEAAGGRGAG